MVTGAYAVVAVFCLWWLLSLYGNFTTGRSFPVALAYIAFLTAGTFLYRFIKPFVNTSFPKFIIIFLIHVVSFGIVFLIGCLFGILTPDRFIEIMPLILVFGVMYWNLLVIRDNKAACPDEQEQPEKDSLPAQEDLPENGIKPLERISVKQGSEIHILKIDEIFYLEAYGDYVFIYTEKDKYIKEQTMRYFETNLPSRFVRIHRSHIINTDFMIRLELFGKESYHIRLRNGTSLRASNAGYKLLKNRLNL